MRQHDVRIGFIVTQLDVVRRPEFLDQVLLEQQRLGLTVGDGDINVGNVGDQRHSLGIKTTGTKIVTDPFAQVAGFADIQDFTILVKHAVNPWPLTHDSQRCLGIKIRSPRVHHPGRIFCFLRLFFVERPGRLGKLRFFGWLAFLCHDVHTPGGCMPTSGSRRIANSS